MRALMLVLLMSCVPLCRAEAESSLMPQAKTAFEHAVPKRHFHDYATAFGDFNGDGITDFVTFIGDPEYGDNGVEDLRIAVFLGAKDNTFRLFDISSEIFGHERVSQNLLIDRQSIFLHRDGPGGCCYHWNEQFQFKIRHGRLELIGLELWRDRIEGTSEQDAGSSVNLLTGQIIKWTGAGKHRKVRKITVPQLKPVPLKDFNYSAFSEKWSDVMW